MIENNNKGWESFIIGQFYNDPPAQSLIHNIVNGIWSKQFRDITVSKLEGNAFLFRIPNASTRAHVLYQRPWQIEGQTMFLADWEPGEIPVKPELSFAPIWLELRGVLFQFFNEEGLERIASLVGHPKLLHPATANKKNLEVDKVFTIIDPRVPLPEAVNVQFDLGDIRRIAVSSPWMPPICSFCKGVGHKIKRCKLASITCLACKSTCHSVEKCPRAKQNTAKTTNGKKAATVKFAEKSADKPAVHHLVGDKHVEKQVEKHATPPEGVTGRVLTSQKSGTEKDPRGKAKDWKGKDIATAEGIGDSGLVSDVESDSSDVSSDSDCAASASEREEGEFIRVQNKKKARKSRVKNPTKH